MTIEQRLRRLEQQQQPPQDDWIWRLSDEERERRIGALVDQFEAAGWPADNRSRVILQVLVRAAQRQAEQAPTPEQLAAVQHWTERLAQVEARLKQ